MDSAAAAPVKVVLELRARAADRELLQDWIRDALRSAGATGALEGSSVLSDGERRFVLLRFATPDALQGWRSSPEAAAVMERGAPFLAPSGPIERTGLETWFALPGAPAAAAPPRWKMALVTWGALLPQVLLLALVVPKGLPFLAGVAISTAVPVCVLTWFAMPRLTRLLAGWLYRPEVSR